MKNENSIIFNTMTEPVILEAINKMAFYIYTGCKKDGKFTYRVNTDPTVKVPNTYNVLRHAGAIYALTEYGMTFGSIPIETIKKSISWLKKTTAIKMKEFSGNEIAIFTGKKITNKKEESHAKLGATSLTILALLKANKLDVNTRLDYINRLAAFLTWMQKEDGSYYSKFIPTTGRNDSWDSLYYPGQTILALSELGGESNILAAINALRYMALQRQDMDNSEAPIDHWALIGTASIFNNHSKFINIDNSTLLQYHAHKIINNIINTLPHTIKRGKNCQIASRLEGLISMNSFINPELTNRDDYENAIQKGISHLLTAFEKTGSYVGGITREYNPPTPDKRSTEIRIDYVQHSLCAFINYYRTFIATF